MISINRTYTLAAGAAACLLFWGCPKRQANVPPQPDTEVETATDALWATFVMTDIHLITAYMAENDHAAHNFNYVVDFTRDPVWQSLNTSFVQTKCRDGILRDGTVFAEYGAASGQEPLVNPNAEYYHQYGFVARVSLSDYKVDGWLVDEYDPQYPGFVYNLLESNQWDPRVKNLKWRIAGKYRFTHPTDPSRNMVWDGVIEKTLSNTSDPAVFATNRQIPIKMALAKMAYTGKASGFTHADKPFSLEVDQKNPLVRDMTCAPDQAAIVTFAGPPTNDLIVSREEYHPFVSGVVSFTTGNAYPRQIYAGNEGHPNLQSQCDNNGEVMIKGISYRVNFRK
jgi:hypothetical protein